MVLYLTSRDAPVGEINSHGIYVNRLSFCGLGEDI